MRAVIFDWDGTLVDTLPAILRANVEVLAEYGVSIDEVRYRASYTPDWRRMYHELGVPEDALEAAGARWLERYAEAGLLRPLAAFSGVRQAVQRLANAGLALGIVTAGDRVVVEDQLARFGMAELIAVRICGDDPYPAKPHPEPLLRALAELGLEDAPTEVAYVGDAPDDMLMAKAVGARAVGIIGIVGTAEDLRSAGADEVLGSVVEWVDGQLAASASSASSPSGPAAPSGPGRRA